MRRQWGGCGGGKAELISLGWEEVKRITETDFGLERSLIHWGYFLSLGIFQLVERINKAGLLSCSSMILDCKSWGSPIAWQRV